jgi:hypothetical protein
MIFQGYLAKITRRELTEEVRKLNPTWIGFSGGHGRLSGQLNTVPSVLYEDTMVKIGVRGLGV